MNNFSKINVGVVGAGHLGAFHIEQYKLLKDASLIGFYDINPLRVKEIQTKHDIKAFESYKDLLRHCDAVSIATPTITHFDVAKRALLMDCHILIEKPITKHVQEAEDLVRLAEKNGKIIQVGHIERFNPAFYHLDGGFFEPLFIESHRLSPFNPRGTDVDVVLDLMIHDIDILLSLVNSKIIEIRASGVSVLSSTVDTANARVEFKNGCVANMTASRISQKKLRKFRFFEKNAYTTIDFLNPSVEKYIVSNKKPSNKKSYVVMNGVGEKYILYKKPNIITYNALKKELENFIDSIVVAQQPIITGQSGLETLRVAIKIQDSIKKSRIN